jgi:starvation-inducible DNA-binding protein
MDCRTECIEIQEFDTVRDFPVGLARDTRLHSCKRLNQILADTQILYALYKKHHWLMRGATCYQLHLLLDKHADEQNELIDKIAERVQTLGGIAVGDPRHVAELTKIRRAPNGCEEVPAMLSRLLEAHETILVDAHDAAAKIAELGDDGSNDLIVSEVIRTGELEAWFLVEHLVDTPLVRVLADARQHNAEPLDLGFFCAERLTLPTPRSLYLSGDATKSRGHA